ncbi:hydroxyethylthiazole kinase [Thalassobacillus cyri]|uniref:Hydroxyethylthiazole kinase n=1 Tax=Thalassobacillus cyri TaxID=571932 RepID=A0A1H3XVV9_9BACI|nr:hydroxyethylthiazole kinase [Thalassobacillus cyri]SEA03360.1 hydroxyethylthiazole kinase [Thalassobacillus cyri]
MNVIEEVRNHTPLVHHLTNQVVMNFTANGLLAFGGAPVMAKADEEAASMAFNADGVLINIGTLTAAEIPAMIRAGKAANEKGIPVVLDPVGVAATPFRRRAVEEILQTVKPAAIKGNAAELANLVDISWEMKGVESRGEGDAEEVAERVARQYNTLAVVTGATDVICNGNRLEKNETGHPLLAKVTGAGCLLGSILTACFTTEGIAEMQAFAAVEFYGLAAEYAAADPAVSGSGTFVPRFIDALSLTSSQLQRGFQE